MMRSDIASVVLADDHPLVLRGLGELIAGEPDFHVVGTASDGASALLRIQEHLPDIAVLDITMPGGFTGLDVLKRITDTSLPVRTIFLTALITDDQILDAVSYGACGILLKESAPETLVECLRHVFCGGKWLPSELIQPAISRTADQREKQDVSTRALTAREAEIVRLVCEGLPNRTIAARLGVSNGTVKVHLHNIYRKLEIGNRTSLAALALRGGAS